MRSQKRLLYLCKVAWLMLLVTVLSFITGMELLIYFNFPWLVMLSPCLMILALNVCSKHEKEHNNPIKTVTTRCNREIRWSDAKPKVK